MRDAGRESSEQTGVIFSGNNNNNKRKFSAFSFKCESNKISDCVQWLSKCDQAERTAWRGDALAGRIERIPGEWGPLFCLLIFVFCKCNFWWANCHLIVVSVFPTREYPILWGRTFSRSSVRECGPLWREDGTSILSKAMQPTCFTFTFGYFSSPCPSAFTW